MARVVPVTKEQLADHFYQMIEDMVDVAYQADELEAAALLEGIVKARKIYVRRRRGEQGRAASGA